MTRYRFKLQYDRIIEAENEWTAESVALEEIENDYIPNMEIEEIEED